MSLNRRDPRGENPDESHSHWCLTAATVGFWNELGSDWSRGPGWVGSNGVTVSDYVARHRPDAAQAPIRPDGPLGRLAYKALLWNRARKINRDSARLYEALQHDPEFWREPA